MRGESERKHPEMISRDPFELDIRERQHRRPHRPSAPAASWRIARDPPLATDFVTMIDYDSPSFMG